MDKVQKEIVTGQKQRKPRRAEIEIYRPGAWRQQRQAALNGSTEVKQLPVTSLKNLPPTQKSFLQRVHQVDNTDPVIKNNNIHPKADLKLPTNYEVYDKSSSLQQYHKTQNVLNIRPKNENVSPKGINTAKKDMNVSNKRVGISSKSNYDNSREDINLSVKNENENPTERNHPGKDANLSPKSNCDSYLEGNSNKTKVKSSLSNASVWKRELIKGNLLTDKKSTKDGSDKAGGRSTQDGQIKQAYDVGLELSNKQRLLTTTLDIAKTKRSPTCQNSTDSNVPVVQRNPSKNVDVNEHSGNTDSNCSFVIYNSKHSVANKLNFDDECSSILSNNMKESSCGSNCLSEEKKESSCSDRIGKRSENINTPKERRDVSDHYSRVPNKVKGSSPIEEHCPSGRDNTKNRHKTATKNSTDKRPMKNKESWHVEEADYNYDKNNIFSYNKDNPHQSKSYCSLTSDDQQVAISLSKSTDSATDLKGSISSSNIVKRKNENSSTSVSKTKCDNQINRGIIHLPATVSANEKDAGHNLPQKLLYNPNNPNKPVFVTASPRDLVNSVESISLEPSKESESYRSSSTPENLNEANKIDPSMLHSLHKGEMDILYYINTNQLPQEFRRIMDIRCHLQSCYEKLLLNDMRLCHERNIENSLWKSLYYLIIEKLRDYIVTEASLRERSLATLHMIVSEGLQYLPVLISKLQATYKFSLDEHFKQDITTQPGVKNRVKQALHSCQKLLLALGDLSRYREHYSPQPNLSTAKRYYISALQVLPRNGRPYNRLAIVAISQKRALDVVYYYIRSLTAANPFMSARDSLVSMFEDIRKKYNSMNSSKSSPEKQLPMEASSCSNKSRFEDMREETWIRPDGGVTNQRTLSQSEFEGGKDSRVKELLKQPSDQLMKHFLTSYLHCHGLLFSRVGLDQFNEVLSNTLDLFQALLQPESTTLSAVHLIQIVAVNIFAIENTQIKDGLLESNYRSAAQELALLLAQEMFGKLCEVTVELLPKNLNDTKVDANPSASQASDDTCSIEALSDDYVTMSTDPQKLFLSDVFPYIPAVKIWCDWLLYHNEQWNPPAQSHDILQSNNSWNSVAALATIVKRLGPPDVYTSTTKEGDSIRVTLPEDNYLKGFSLLLPAVADVSYVHPTANVERVRDWLRLNKLQLCLTQLLCGVEPPILRLQRTDQGEVMVPIFSADVLDKCDDDAEDTAECGGDEGTSEGDTTLSDEDEFTEDEPAGRIDSMKSFFIQKDKIEKRERRHKKRQDRMAIALQMEIRPRVLVPDTNCFIKHLDLIEKIVKNSSYEMMVPLVVIDELESLSRDTAVEKYGDAAQAVTVREGAASGLQFLRSTLGWEHCRNLKCVTSQGSILTSAIFTDEIGNQGMTNDDRILSCCMSFFKDNNVRRPITEGVRRLYREVVLLTDDIHLRVRAYSKDVPVRNLTDFANWAGIK